jgi:hypothetical protein
MVGEHPPLVTRKDMFCLLAFGCTAAEFRNPPPARLEGPVTPEIAEMHRTHLDLLQGVYRTCWVGLAGLAVAFLSVAFLNHHFPFAQVLPFCVAVIATIRVRRALAAKREVVNLLAYSQIAG